MDIYEAFVTGYVKGDPKVFNNQVASFTVASFKGKNKDGEAMGYACNDVKAFKGTADYVSQNVHDGDYVIVKGETGKSHYTNREGKEVWTQEITARIVRRFEAPQQSGGAWK